MKRILITNDDGLSSPGLTTLAHELLRTGRYELRVVAPEKEQSGVGHCITLHWPLYAEKVTLPDPIAGIPAFHVAGTPADCVKIGITNLFPNFNPDLIISGINRGPNVGLNVLYSGTCAGALEACMNGIPAVAVSLAIPDNALWHFALAAELTVPIIDATIATSLTEWTALNVNIPNVTRDAIKGTLLTKHGRSGFKEYYVEEPPEGTRRRFLLEGRMIYRENDIAYDAVALREGYISISPLGPHMQNNEAWERVKAWPMFKAPKT